jgi:hypothetical protein
MAPVRVELVKLAAQVAENDGHSDLSLRAFKALCRLDGSIHEMLRELGMIGGNGQDRTATADQMEVSDAA